MDTEIAWYIFTLSGLIVGFIVGVTGVGGGSLMTPILIALGIPAIKAVATDLLYAGLTKIGGIFVHQKQKTINWKITSLMALGSLSATLITFYFLIKYNLNDVSKESEKLIKITLAIALFITSFTILIKGYLKRFKKSHHKKEIIYSLKNNIITIIIGFFIGILVCISSIGAGAIGTIALFILYPSLSTKKIVGTDIAHAVPLTLIAGGFHVFIDKEPIHWQMLLFLLLGSLPGIYLGSHFGGKISDKILRPVLALMLFIIGWLMIYPFIVNNI